MTFPPNLPSASPSLGVSTALQSDAHLSQTSGASTPFSLTGTFHNKILAYLITLAPASWRTANNINYIWIDSLTSSHF